MRPGPLRTVGALPPATPPLHTHLYAFGSRGPCAPPPPAPRRPTTPAAHPPLCIWFSCFRHLALRFWNQTCRTKQLSQLRSRAEVLPSGSAGRFLEPHPPQCLQGGDVPWGYRGPSASSSSSRPYNLEWPIAGHMLGLGPATSSF